MSVVNIDVGDASGAVGGLGLCARVHFRGQGANLKRRVSWLLEAAQHE
jgi:hypothetical protein